MPWQPAPVDYPDIELLLCDAYQALLPQQGVTGVVVDRKVPDPRPDRLVAFIRDGGTQSGLRDRPRVRCRVFAPDDDAAIDLARLVLTLAPLVVRTNAAVLHYAHQSGPIDVTAGSGPEWYCLLEFHTRPTQQLGA